MAASSSKDKPERRREYKINVNEPIEERKQRPSVLPLIPDQAKGKDKIDAETKRKLEVERLLADHEKDVQQEENRRRTIQRRLTEDARRGSSFKWEESEDTDPLLKVVTNMHQAPNTKQRNVKAGADDIARRQIEAVSKKIPKK